MSATPGVERVTQAEFARRLGVDRAHVTRLKQAGRLVIEGGLIRVDASLARIAATSGGRDDVAARHAAARGAALPSAPAPVEIQTVGDDVGDALRRAKAREQIAQAAIREMERDQLAGELVRWADVELAAKHVGAAVRAALENFPDQVAPLVAPVTDLDEVHEILMAQSRNVLLHVLDEIGRRLRRASEGEPA